MRYQVAMYKDKSQSAFFSQEIMQFSIDEMVQRASAFAKKHKCHVLLEFKPKTWHYEFDESGSEIFDDPPGNIQKVQGDVGVVPTQFSDPANCTSGVG